MPRKISEFSYWKASELETFLLVYSLPVLKNIMTEEYSEHHILLVHAISLLNFSSVSDEMVEIARRLLTEYVTRFVNLYAKKFMTCNIHFLLHLPDDVKKFGRLWVLSCYPFENFLGIIKNYVHGSNHPELQICSAVINFISLAELKDRYLEIESLDYCFCKKIEKSGTHRRKIKEIDENMYIAGVSKKVQSIPSYVKNVLSHNAVIIDKSKCHFFHTLLSKGIYYETECYAEAKKSNSTFIKFTYDNNVCVGIVQTFLRVCKCPFQSSCDDCNDECKNYAIVLECKTEKVFMCDFIENNNNMLISLTDISNICCMRR